MTNLPFFTTSATTTPPDWANPWCAEWIKPFDLSDVFKPKPDYRPKRILKSGNATIVFWKDGTKTIVKRSPDEPESDYAAFTAALGIKLFGSNSALKRIVERTETQKPKKKAKDNPQTAKTVTLTDEQAKAWDEWFDYIEKQQKGRGNE